MRRIRASYYFIGSMLGRFGMAKTTMPGGCNFGVRPTSLACFFSIKDVRVIGVFIFVMLAVRGADAFFATKRTKIIIVIIAPLFMSAFTVTM